MQHLAPDAIRQNNRRVNVQQRVSVLVATVFADEDGVWTCQVSVDDNTSWTEETAVDIATTRLTNEIIHHSPGVESDQVRITLTHEERINSTNPDSPGITIFTYKEAP